MIAEGPTINQPTDPLLQRASWQAQVPVAELKKLGSFFNWWGANYRRVDLTTPALYAIAHALVAAALIGFGAFVATVARAG